MKTHDCNCKGSGATTAALLERPRYYPRQLVTPEVLTLGQDYMRDKLRLHNRMLHGWGVACGLKVTVAPTADKKGFEAWKVMVEPGYALMFSGDDVWVRKEQVIDLRNAEDCSDPCGKPTGDPWCADLYIQRDPGTYYIAIRYAETMVRPERVQPSGCGCSNESCENSRWKDGYEIGVLCDCPHGDATPPDPKFEGLLTCANMDCPQCASNPWVGLALVEFDTVGQVTVIDNCICRRNVISFANFWWKCDCAKLDLQREGAIVAVQQDDTATVKIKAGSVDPRARISAGRDVEITNEGIKDGILTLKVKPSPKASPGERTLVVVNPDGTMATLPAAFEVAPPKAAGPPKPRRAPVVPHR